MTEISDAN